MAEEAGECSPGREFCRNDYLKAKMRGEKKLKKVIFFA